MNFSDVIDRLSEATAFDLYRMRAAIDRALEQPQLFEVVRARLRVGQVVEYFDSRANAIRIAQVLDLRRKQVLLIDLATRMRWLITYAAINVDGAQVSPGRKPRRGLDRTELAVGDVVGFVDRDQRPRSGCVLRLSEKTVSVRCGCEQWRIAYALLYRVIDSQMAEGEPAASDSGYRDAVRAISGETSVDTTEGVGDSVA